jgi:hypothetical protein
MPLPVRKVSDVAGKDQEVNRLKENVPDMRPQAPGQAESAKTIKKTLTPTPEQWELWEQAMLHAQQALGLSKPPSFVDFGAWALDYVSGLVLHDKLLPPVTTEKRLGK